MEYQSTARDKSFLPIFFSGHALDVDVLFLRRVDESGTVLLRRVGIAFVGLRCEGAEDELGLRYGVVESSNER